MARKFWHPKKIEAAFVIQIIPYCNYISKTASNSIENIRKYGSH